MDDSTRAVYETRAEEWAERRPPSLIQEASAFSRRVLPGRPIVDLGCGPGGYFPSLGRPLVGLDGARAMLEAARRVDPEVAMVQADLMGLPFAPRRLGGGWARASYLHLPRHDLPIALAHLQQALAVGAPLEMTMRVGSQEGPLPDDPFPGRFFAHWQADELAPVLRGAGFIVDGIGVSGDWVTVRARAGRTLPDFVGPGMRLLVCGLNPSVVSADLGFGYAGATNRFWPAAAQAGMIRGEHARRPFQILARDRVGMTDLVKRATARASQLNSAEYRAGAARVAAMVSWLRPEMVVFVGLAGYRAAVDRCAHAGWQEQAFGGAPAYVMPSTSGLNAATSLSSLVAHMEALGKGGR